MTAIAYTHVDAFADAPFGGNQAAVMVPTTILAEQHHRTFTERMSESSTTSGFTVASWLAAQSPIVSPAG